MTTVRAAIHSALVVVESDATRALVDDIHEVITGEEPALIEGERGAGRELIARIIHFAGRRKEQPFITVDAGTAPRLLMRDRLDKQASGPLEAAEGGTLLVKDLLALPKASQRMLARVLRSDEHDVRVLASCNEEIQAAVELDVFHRPLFNRLAGNTLLVPPLRERVADIPALTVHFVREYAREIDRGRMTVSTRAFELLTRYPWPGNVSELKELARRLVLRAPKSRIEAAHIDALLPAVAARIPLEEISFEDMVHSKLGAFLRRLDGYPVAGLYSDVIARVERPLLKLVMEHTGQNQLKTAEILGLNRNTLRRKLAEHGLHARTKRAPARRDGTVTSRNSQSS